MAYPPHTVAFLNDKRKRVIEFTYMYLCGTFAPTILGRLASKRAVISGCIFLFGCLFGCLFGRMQKLLKQVCKAGVSGLINDHDAYVRESWRRLGEIESGDCIDHTVCYEIFADTKNATALPDVCQMGQNWVKSQTSMYGDIFFI